MANAPAPANPARADGSPRASGQSSRVIRWIRDAFASSDVKFKCARVLYKSVDMEYRGMDSIQAGQDDPQAKSDAEARQIAGEIQDKYARKPRSLTIEDSILYEKMLVRLLPAARRRTCATGSAG
jgi:hypothetical protein